MAIKIMQLDLFGFLLEWVKDVLVVSVQTTYRSDTEDKMKQTIEAITT